jgi:hypothetical protein
MAANPSAARRKYSVEADVFKRETAVARYKSKMRAFIGDAGSKRA